MSQRYEDCKFNSEDLLKFKEVCEQATQVVAYYPHHYSGNGHIRGPFCRWFNVDDNASATHHEKRGDLASKESDINYAALALSAFPNALNRISQLEAENADLRKSKFNLVEICATKNIEIDKLKAELVKERECVDFYAAKTNWGKTNQSSINRMPLSDTTQDGAFQYRGVWVSHAEIAGKRARQRQKERDQSILKDSNEE